MKGEFFYECIFFIFCFDDCWVVVCGGLLLLLLFFWKWREILLVGFLIVDLKFKLCLRVLVNLWILKKDKNNEDWFEVLWG